MSQKPNPIVDHTLEDNNLATNSVPLNAEGDTSAPTSAAEDGDDDAAD